MLNNVFFFLFAAILVCCLLLGGGTRAGFIADAIAQLAAVPLLLASLWRLVDLPSLRLMRWAIAFCAAIVLLPMLQLVPLPPEVWTALPNREPVAAAFGLLQQDLPWMPISVSPRATALSALSLLPPIAIFLAMLSLRNPERRLMSLIVLGVGVLSVVVGLNQIAQGSGSALRFYAQTSYADAVGFFANRNHFAALLYAVMLIAAAWAVEAAVAFENGRQTREGGGVVALAATFTVMVALVAAQAMARSRAGLGLTIVALAGTFVLAFLDRRNATGFTPARLLLGAVGLAIMFASQFALYRILERFSPDQLEDTRLTFARNTIEAAKAYMPFGSGMGTFVPVYAMYEKPADALIDAYVNRAHNDILELWLEAGVPGLVLMGLFLAWLARASWMLWRPEGAGAAGIDLLLARAATLIVALLVAHSFVDYPLRTGAMMAIMAFACGLLVAPPLTAGGKDEAAKKRPQRRRREPAEGPAQTPQRPRSPASAPASTPADRPGETWGRGIQWPEEWRSGAKQRPAPKPPRPGEPPKKD